MFGQLKVDIGEYVKGKKWYWYFPVWVSGIYVFFQLLEYELGEAAPFLISIAHSFNYLLHEFAHMVTAFLPAVITASAGSLSELLLGSLLIWGAFKGKTYFASLICCLWFMLACQSAGDYMADARTMNLQLTNFDVSGATPIHDWNSVFSELGILKLDKAIGGFISIVGIAAGLAGLVFSAWLMYRMAGAANQKALNEKEAQLLHEQAAAALSSPAPPKHFEQVKDGSLYPVASKGRLADEPKKASDDGKR
jgi:hypothetical protein